VAKGELENKSRKPRDLFRKLAKGQPNKKGLVFLRVRRREMMLLMMKMMMR
jgi:hypothetical protein